MVHSVLGSVRSLVWVVLVLCGLLYIFGVSLTWGAYEYCNEGWWQDPSTEALRQEFGTLQRALLSLYMAIIGGRDWVMNVVTGVFVDSALEFRKSDRDLVIQEALYNKDRYQKNIRELFAEIDIANSGSVSLEEFMELMDDSRAVAFFAALELDIMEARTLFRLLDVDHSGRVDTNEFLTGCQKLKGGARTVDLAVIQREIQWLLDMFVSFSGFVEDKLNSM